MTSKERFKVIFEYEGEFDRFPTTYYGTPEINQQLKNYFATNFNEELLDILGEDFRRVGPKYMGPKLKKYEDGFWEGLWGERYKAIFYKGGEYPEAAYLPFNGNHEKIALFIKYLTCLRVTRCSYFRLLTMFFCSLVNPRFNFVILTER